MPKRSQPISKTKIGLILECGPQGADKQVCEFLVQKLLPDATVTSATLTNKKQMIAGCGEAANQLFKNGCSSVLIVWDLYPPWGTNKPCLHDDRVSILKSLENAGVSSNKVVLICIHQELEAWLLADERAVSDVPSTPAHPVRLGKVKRVEQMPNPKKELIRLFKQHRGYSYSDLQDAIKIVAKIQGCTRLRKCETFVRFANKGLGVTI